MVLSVFNIVFAIKTTLKLAYENCKLFISCLNECRERRASEDHKTYTRRATRTRRATSTRRGANAAREEHAAREFTFFGVKRVYFGVEWDS